MLRDRFVVATTGDDVGAVCGRLGALGVRVVEVVAPGEHRRVLLGRVGDGESAARVAALLRDEGLMAVSRPGGGVALDRWLEETRPVVFGDRISVCVAWSEHERGGLPGLIELGPGGFGNGRHPTTRQMIELLVQRITGGERVLDVGCGSGVLGLCALKLGAASVVAVDINSEAVGAARRNAAINGMSDDMLATVEPVAGLRGSFDVVVANIARAGIVELAPELIPRLAPGGWLAAGGLSPSQCSQVAGFLQPLVEVERRTAGDWSTVVMAPT